LIRTERSSFKGSVTISIPCPHRQDIVAIAGQGNLRQHPSIEQYTPAAAGADQDRSTTQSARYGIKRGRRRRFLIRTGIGVLPAVSRS